MTVALNEARSLSLSCPDFVAVEDLAALFEGHQVDEALANDFKTTVQATGPTIRIWERIYLRTGPGPIIVRAFQETRYLPMVILCSMLSSVFEISDLAQVIRDTFE